MIKEMAMKVNMILREEAEKNKEDVSISVYDILQPLYLENNITYLLPALAKDEKQMNTFLDRMWKQFGHFLKDSNSMRIKKIEQELSEEVNDLNKKCLRNETCWMIVEKGTRSIVALINLGQHPNAGSYLSHHMSRIFNSASYISPNKWWPWAPFYQDNSDELTLDFNQYLMSMTYELSDTKVKNLSLLDLPAFGSKFGSFKENCDSSNWSIQQNMAIYNKLMSSNNYTWSDSWSDVLDKECNDLRKLWKKYMRSPKEIDFPPNIKINNYFNFTGYIKDEMSTFLTAYSASFPNILNNTKVWSEVANKVFLDNDYSEDYVKAYGLYDKLIMDSVYQKPLFSESDNLEGQADLYPVLTSNGLCYSFNGIDTSDVWRQTLRSTKILESFSKVFGTLKHETKKFRGIGHSEGMPC